jgi:arylsulfatase A-like enzyme
MTPFGWRFIVSLFNAGSSHRDARVEAGFCNIAALASSSIAELMKFFSFLLAGFFAVTGSVLSAPNVIYILADDLGYGDLSCYGQTKISTPNIDRLAAEGLKFTHHYSGNTVCSPSRASLMTGQHPGVCYLRGNVTGERPMDPAMTVLPEVFKAAGYATGAYGKWGLGWTVGDGPNNPLTHGFDEFYGWKSQGIAHTYFPSSVVHNGREIPLEPNTYVHSLIMDQAQAFIRARAEAGTPFFCYIPTAIPHAAMHAPAEIHEKWRKRFPEFDHLIGKYGAGPDDPCPDVINPIAGFAAMLEVLDTDVGNLLALLKELGIDDNTLVLFTSDNGAHKEGGHDPDFWNSTGGLRGHKRDMHEGGIRTPMLARWPGTVPAGKVSSHISAFWDVLPTVCELIEQPIPPQNTGISFLPTLRGEARQPQHEALYFEFCNGADQKIVSQALRMNQWKAFIPAGGSMEIYDLNADPFETQDLAASRPDLVETLSQLIQKHREPLPEQGDDPFERKKAKPKSKK